MVPWFRPLAVAAFLMALAIPAWASLAEAESAFRRGAALERAGDCQGALVEYQAALAHYPNYFYAQRQIGNCQARLGQPQRALQAYDLYLAARPGDAAVRDYAERLRASTPAASAKPISAAAPSGFYAGAGVTMVQLGVSDINAFVADEAPKANAPVGMAMGVEGGWRHASGFYVQGGWFTGLAKSHSWKENSDITEVSVKQSMSGFYLAPGFRMRLPIQRPITVGGHLGLGAASIAFEHKSKTTLGPSSSESTTSANLAPTLVLAEARADYAVTPQLNLGLSLGYQGAEQAKIEGSNGTLKNAKGGDAKADFNGLRAGLVGTWSF